MNSNDKKVTFAGFGILFIMIVTALIFGSNVSVGEEGNSTITGDALKEFQINRTTESFSGELDEGASQTFPLNLEGKLLKNLTATITWQDESELSGRPRIRRYENQPDSFAVGISDMEGNNTDTATGSNPVGKEGNVRAHLSVENSVLAELLESDYNGETWSVDVTMVQAGMWSPQVGFIGFTDNGNSFSLVVEYEYYDLAMIKGD